MNIDLSIIKDACRSKHITLFKLCNDLNINYQTLLYNIKNGSIPIKRWKKIADYLEINDSLIFDNSGAIAKAVEEERQKQQQKKSATLDLSIIKEACKSRNITLKQMCNDLNITYESLRHNINSGFMSIDRWRMIANYLEIDESLIFDPSKSITKAVDEEKAQVRKEEKAAPEEPEYHCGKLVKKRMEELDMSQLELSHILETQKQNINRLLKSKTINIEMMVKLNDILNPPGSEPWDIFEHFRRNHDEELAEKYIALLEKHLLFKDYFIRVCSRYGIPIKDLNVPM